MRKLATFVAIITVVLLFWPFNRAPAATPSLDAPPLFSARLHPGDHLTLYLRHYATGSVAGTLQSYDGSAFELSGEGRAMISKGSVVGISHEKVLYIVPRENVVLVEKTLSSEFVPSTQP